MKRLTAWLTAVCLLLCLTACGGEEAAPAPTTTTTTTTTTTAATTTEATTENITTTATAAATTTTTSVTAATAAVARPASTRPVTTTVSTPAPTTAKPLVDVEKEKLSVLIIGNSHSIDAFWLLYQAYTDQHPNTDLCVGILHYNGAAIDEHVAFIESNEAVIRYYKNNTGRWEVQYDVTAESVLTDQPWDVIMMQPAKEDLADETLNQDGRRALAEAVNRYVKHPHEFVWHVSWPSPNDETFFSPDYVRQPPVGYKDKLTRLYGFNPVTQFTLMTEMTKKWVLEDPLYSNAVCAGSAVMHALLTQGMTQLDLWRDYTHLSDYGRLMVGYALTAQLTGQPITEVGIDVIYIRWRHKQNKAQGPQTLTPAMKQGIVEAANYSLKAPWSIPPQKYPVPTVTTTTTTTVTTTERITKPVVSATAPSLTTERTTTEATTTTTEESWIDSDCVLPTSTTEETKSTKATD